jgi:hypothetical protein
VGILEIIGRLEGTHVAEWNEFVFGDTQPVLWAAGFTGGALLRRKRCDREQQSW